MRYSLRARLIVVFISLAIGPLLVAGMILSWQSFTGLEQQALVLQQEAAKGVASQVSAFFEELEHELRLTVQAQLLGEDDRDLQRSGLANLLAYQRAFDELHLLDSQGQERVGVYRIGLGSTAPVDRSHADEFVIPQTTGQVYYGPIRYDEMTNEPVMTIAIPVINLRTGLADGVLVSVARIKTVWDLIASIQVSEGQSVYIVAAEGQVVAHRNPSVVLRGTSFMVPEEPGIQPGLSGARAVLAYVTMSLGQQQLHVVAEQNVSEALSLAYNTIRISAGLLVVVLIVAVALALATVRQIVQPLRTMVGAAQAISTGDLSQQIPITRQDELGVLANTFNSMTTQLQSLVRGLEQRVNERTADLEQRTRYLEATTQVGRAAASILDVEQLIAQVVELICERFSLYYVGLFLLDEAGDWAVLRSGTGEAGREMLARGHRIRVGDGMIGWSVAFGKSRVALEADADAVRLATAELPETRSEAALPLRARGEILGALSVQATEPGVFDQETMAVLQTMADQVALAIDNAQLVRQAHDALEAARRAYGDVRREAWTQLFRVRAGEGYRCDDRGVMPVADAHPAQGQKAAADTGMTGLPELILPVATRGQVLVEIEAHKADPREWTEEEVELMRSLGDQLSVALESARLYQEAQERAARERLLGDVGVRIRETLDMDTVLRTALQEIGSSLDLAEVA
ncbi:MAG: GAF domain-containing protein, partial [Anaerolineae bacterium]|nr:GAF domain-containing protein [Anaerolineae bacterium]